MKEKIQGKVFVLSDNIDTDQIIPAQYLVYSLEKPEEKKFYGKYALSSVPMERSGLPHGGISFVGPNSFRSEFTIIVAGKNFGCGSSREHAPAALQIAGVEAVVAVSYARIFYRNAVDGGFIIPFESFSDLSQEMRTNDLVEIDRDLNEIRNLTTDQTYPLKPLGDVGKIVAAGGIFEYARKRGMLK